MLHITCNKFMNMIVHVIWFIPQRVVRIVSIGQLTDLLMLIDVPMYIILRILLKG